MTKEAKDKAKFRQTSKWKKFRAFMKKKADGKDFVTQMPLRAGWQLHHGDMSEEHYQNLEAENFFCLSKTSHEMVHWLFRYTDWRGMLERLYVILEKMETLNKKGTN